MPINILILTVYLLEVNGSLFYILKWACKLNLCHMYVPAQTYSSGTASLHCIYSGTSLKGDTSGTTLCPEYGGICYSGASDILPVGMVMCFQAVEHKEATFSDDVEKSSTMSYCTYIMPGLYEFRGS